MANNDKKKKSKNNVATPCMQPSPQADSQGRMPERQGRHFYKLWTLLCAVAVPRMNAERVSLLRLAIPWNMEDITANSVENRDIVMTYILQHIDELVTAVEAQPRLAQKVLGRRLTQDDRMHLQAWRLHVKDDFIILGHLPYKGTVMCQVGRLRHRDWHQLEAPQMIEGEYHEPRLFIVQGLADSLQYLTTGARALMAEASPSIAKKHSKYSDALCMVHTSLLPYNGGITYMTTMMPMKGGDSRHYGTPQDFAAAVDKAVEAYEAAMNDNSLIYHTLDPVRDAAICRLASAPANQSIPLAYRGDFQLDDPALPGKNASSLGTETTILVNQMMWQPTASRNDPQFEELLDKLSYSGEFSSHEKRPMIVEGMKNVMGQEVIINDDDPCPFHKRYGDSSASFIKCCKTAYLKRVRKATEKGHTWKNHFMYDPMEHEEMEAIEQAHPQGGVTINLLNLMRIQPQDVGKVRLRVELPMVPTVKERMHTSPYFHSVLEYKWMYWGPVPCKLRGMGIMTFGDVVLDPVTGNFEAEAMTSGRLSALIREMKHVCKGLPILEASLELEPSYKTKPDPMAFKRNKELLQGGLDIEIRATIDKEANISMGLHCEFCGIPEEELGSKLLRCACKLRFYCSKEHQRQHWKDHKEECRKRREATS